MDAFFFKYSEDCSVFLCAVCSPCSILIQNFSLAVYMSEAYQSITSANDTTGVIRNNSVTALMSSIFNISIQTQ